MNGEREFAEAIARRAGAELLRRYRPSGQERVRTKGGSRDLVTEADGASEAIILRALAEAFPGDAVMAEETRPEAVRRGRVWIVDPLDGTVNFAHGVPLFSVSVALLEDGEPLAGCVHAPCLGETFTAARGDGTRLNGSPVRVSGTNDLSRALLCTGFAYRRNELAENNVANHGRMVLESRDVRRLGSAALDLAFVACGRYDGFWELWLSPWDVAAGVLLVREAGGTVTTIPEDGEPIFGTSLLAANGDLHRVIRPRLTAPPAG